MTTLASAAPRFDIGRVVQRTFGAVIRNWASFGLLAVLAQIPAWAVMALRPGFGLPLVSRTLDFSPTGGVFSLLGGLALLISSSGLQGAVLHGVVADLNGRKPTFQEGLRIALRYLLPLLGLNLLVWIAIILGWILLVVPGVMMGMAWFVAGPVLVTERTGVGRAFTRSAELTRGHRWALFGLTVIYFVAVWILELAAFAAAGGPTNLLTQMASAQTGWPLLVVSTVLGLALAVISTAGVASTYVELRAIKEGIGADSLANVFD